MRNIFLETNKTNCHDVNQILLKSMLGPFFYLLPNTFQIIWIYKFLIMCVRTWWMFIFSETSRAHFLWYLRFDVFILNIHDITRIYTNFFFNLHFQGLRSEIFRAKILFSYSKYTWPITSLYTLNAVLWLDDFDVRVRNLIRKIYDDRKAWYSFI